MGTTATADGRDVDETKDTPDSGEAGFSLLELLLVMVISIVVVGLPLTLALSSFKTQNQAASRSASASRAQIGVDRLVRDLRQATAAAITSTQTPAVAVLTIPGRRTSSTAPAVPPTTVTWTCTPTAFCTRQSSSGETTQYIPGVTTATFTPTFPTGTTTPSRVDVSIQSEILDQRRGAGQALDSATPVTFRDGVDLRNIG